MFQKKDWIQTIQTEAIVSYPSTETGWNKSVFHGEADEMKRLEKVNQRRAIQRSGDALVTFWAKQPDEPFQKH